MAGRAGTGIAANGVAAQATRADLAMIEAAGNGRTEEVKKLPAQGARVDDRDRDGWTPRAWAAYHYRVAVAKALIAAGADGNARKNNGYSVLKLAKSGGWPLHVVWITSSPAGAAQPASHMNR